LTVIVALTAPLAVNLRERARAELETQVLVEAQAVAAGLDAGRLEAPPARLQQLALRYARQVDGRLLIMDATGRVLADGNVLPEPNASAVGLDYDTEERPEILAALDPTSPRANAQIRFSDELGSDIIVAAAPILDELRLVGAVRITRDVQEVTDSVRRVTIGIGIVGAAGLVAGLLIAFGVAGSLARPLTRLAGTALRLGAGDLSARAGRVEGPTEIEELARSFDEMADRLERTVRAQQEFVANASHQLRTPLTGMKLRIESAKAEATSDDVRRQLEAAEREVDRLSDIVDRLLETARRIEQGEPSTSDLRRAVSQAVERWRERAELADGSLAVSSIDSDRGVSDTEVAANQADVDQILDNLIENAIRYAPGPVTIEIGRDGDRALLAVRDRGPGIHPEYRARVTERFYRGRGAPPGGSGLGLAIARELVERSGGELAVQSQEDRGTRIEVRFRIATHPPDDENP
jgi:signal transduction histidine kinase